jgi:hypothetical protein
MARFTEPTADTLAAFQAKLAHAPKTIRKTAEEHDPWTLYRLKPTGQRVTIESYGEDGTVTVAVLAKYNPGLTFERDVFGVKPSALEPCDLLVAAE